MINLYINYPNKKFTIHGDLECSFIRSHEKENQRVISINYNSATKELLKFLDNQYRFASEKDFNDMWVIIDFDDVALEYAIVDHLWVLSVRNYEYFRGVVPETHCDPAH